LLTLKPRYRPSETAFERFRFAVKTDPAIDQKEDEYMFEQINNGDGTNKKTWKARLLEGAIILAVAALVIGSLLYALS